MLGYLKKKFRVTKDVEEALNIDKENGSHLWWETLCKEINNVCVDFELFYGEVSDITYG